MSNKNKPFVTEVGSDKLTFSLTDDNEILIDSPMYNGDIKNALRLCSAAERYILKYRKAIRTAIKYFK